MKYGEIIELGRHKLMCGDATRREDVMRLVDGEKVDLEQTEWKIPLEVANDG